MIHEEWWMINDEWWVVNEAWWLMNDDSWMRMNDVRCYGSCRGPDPGGDKSGRGRFTGQQGPNRDYFRLPKVLESFSFQLREGGAKPAEDRRRLYAGSAAEELMVLRDTSINSQKKWASRLDETTGRCLTLERNQHFFLELKDVLCKMITFSVRTRNWGPFWLKNEYFFRLVFGTVFFGFWIPFWISLARLL